MGQPTEGGTQGPPLGKTLVIVVVVFVSAFNEMSVATTSEDEMAIPKLALNSGTTRRSAKNTQPYIATKPS